MKRPLHTLIRLLGCMTILLFLTGLFFGIFFRGKEDTAGLLGAIGSIAGMIYVISSVIYWYMDPGSF